MESTYLDLSYHKREWRRHQGKANFLYVRYADDFVVLCNGTKAQAQTMKEELQAVLRQMGLELSEEKTKVTHITEGFDFLGYRIIRRLGRKGQMAPKVLIPKKAIKKFHTPSNLVVAHWSSEVESTALLDFLLRHGLWTPFGGSMSCKIRSIISAACDFTTKSDGIWEKLCLY